MCKLDRWEAAALGIRIYDGGVPCKYGHTGGRYTSSGACKQCTSAADKTSYWKDREKHLARSMWHNAKRRAKVLKLPFDLAVEDIKIPSACPVLGITLRMAEGSPDEASPTLDKVVPAKGYVRGNIVVVSKRANRLKNDATISELKALAKFYGRMEDD